MADEGRPGAASPAADVRLVGEAAGNAPLATLLRELLDRHDISARVTSQAQFDPEELLASEGPARAIVAFVDLEGGRQVRLYVRDPAGDRFLLRELTLAHGLDEVGREAIAQVVESSVDVLLRTPSAALSRGQARTAIAQSKLGERAVTVPAQPVGPPPSPPKKSAPSSPAMASQPPSADRAGVSHRPAWLARFEAHYAGAWWGPSFGAGHGPGIALGAARVIAGSLGDRRAWTLGATAIVERPFTQTLATPPLDASIDTLETRLLVDVAWLLGVHTLSLGAGAGADFVEATPTRAHDASVTLANGSAHTIADVRFALGYSVGGASWQIGAEAFVDAAVTRDHYELASSSESVVLASPWMVRPGAALTLLYRFAF
jgi:hypothetical protein